MSFSSKSFICLSRATVASPQTRTQYLELIGYRCIFKLRARAKFVQKLYQFTLPPPKWGSLWCFYSLFESGVVEDWIPRSKDLLSHTKPACILTGPLQGRSGL